MKLPISTNQAWRAGQSVASALVVPLILLASPGLAQDASLVTPVTRTSEAKYVVSRVLLTPDDVRIQANVQDANGAIIRVQEFIIPDGTHATATVAGFVTAFATARTGETGGVLRRANFRILGYLADQGYLSGVTLNP